MTCAGKPAELVPFPELDIGRDRIADDTDDSERGKDEHACIASLDPTSAAWRHWARPRIGQRLDYTLRL